MLKKTQANTEKNTQFNVERFLASQMKNTIPLSEIEELQQQLDKQILEDATSTAINLPPIPIERNAKTAIKKLIFKLLKPLRFPANYARRFFTRTLHISLESFHKEIKDQTHLKDQIIAQRIEMAELREVIYNIQNTLLNFQLQSQIQNSFLPKQHVIFEKENKILIKANMGYLFCGLDDVTFFLCLMDSGDLELGTRLLIERLLSPGSTFIDIGANYGIHVLAAYRAMQGKGKIIAFEPFPRTFQLLKESVKLNQILLGNNIIELYQDAVSNKSGQDALFLGEVSGHHSLYPLQNMPSSSLEIKVNKVRLDDILPSDLKIDLIKIDVEGAELDVLEGATATLKSNNNIALIVEFGPSHIKRTGHSISGWLKKFTDLGFEFKIIKDIEGTLENWTLEKLESSTSVNLLFARKDSTVWKKL